MLNPLLLPEYQRSKKHSVSLPDGLKIAEIENAAYDANAGFYTQPQPRNSVVLDKANVGMITPFMKSVTKKTKQLASTRNKSRRTNKKYKRTKAFTWSLNKINSSKKFIEIWLSKILDAIISNDEQMKDVVIERLDEDFDEMTPYYDKDGIKHYNVKVKVGSNPMKAFEKFMGLCVAICEEYHILLLVCLSELDRILNYPDYEDMIRLFREQIWTQHRVVLVSACKSHKLFSDLTQDTMKGQCVPMEFSPLSQESFKQIITGSLKGKYEEIPEECLDRLCSFSNGNIDICIELVNKVKDSSPDQLSLPAIEDTIDSLIMENEILFRGITNGLSKDVVKLLNQLANGRSLNDARCSKGLNFLQEQVDQIKYDLIELGILSEVNSHVRFVNPLYRAWLADYSDEEEGYWD